MADDREQPPKKTDTRKLILARRARFVAAALAGVAATATVASTNEACGGGTADQNETDPKPCLKITVDSGDDPPDGSGTGTADEADGGDGGGTKKDGSIIKFDAEPQPCLFAPIDDGG